MQYERPECDFCGKPIRGMVTNVGGSIDVILSCQRCMGSE